ncbi:aspartoacylase [Celerinatantimonas diazotrophica]|uniref:Aspartoacylase n=1 Tax=Celerinatantimonas diazotrophica TaxID=412034 RepID=A0A4R1J838_9GAMM|nr:aspartoacylase [Celerinatantimonas diazotrophica]TCK46698.1 aspartoacylase [Celerinatantimonas diazotrophica]CAG9295400.1 aspartoacylase [Celerinatantimonas diazotrophica]
MEKINSVAILGGTHGNEFSGIYLLKKWHKHSEQISRPTLNVETLLANPKAFAANKRYLDADLNRQFRTDLLADPTLGNYEQSRAKALSLYLGSKEQPKFDFVLDLHNTTSNMGPCLLLVQQHPMYNLMAGYVKLKMPQVNISRDEDHKSKDEHHLLATMGKFGVIVEVGPQPQGCLRHDVLAWMEELTGHILDFLELYNNDQLPELPKSVEAYRFIEEVKIPLDENGERAGMVHQALEGNDFKPLKKGDPMYITFDDEVIPYQGEQTVYPNFINEAAYYDNNLAMSLSEKVTIDVYSTQ